MERLQNFNLVSMMNGLGASSFAPIQEILEKMTIEKIGYLPTLKDLYNKYKKNFICCTYNLSKGCSEYLSHETNPDLPSLIALRMSANLPLVFEKYLYDGNYYIDGAISDNFPIDIADANGTKIIGIVLSSEQENFNKLKDMDILEYIHNLIHIPCVQSVEFKIKLASSKCKIVRLCYENIKVFNFSVDTRTKLDMFSKGYQQMKFAVE
jgi:predicted acylesterase/phospholipase RssA